MPTRLHAPREPLIRQALKAWLGARAPGAALVDELGIEHGKFRVDLCAIAHELHGYEIKSDQDTLSRLPAQAKHFSLVFHRMTLVVGPALLGRSLAIVPPWWGILLVTEDEHGRTRFAELREAQANPRPNYRWVVRLLWRDELTACLRAAGSRGWSRLRYWEIANRMLEVFTPEELTARVTTVLRLRKGAPAPLATPAPLPALTPQAPAPLPMPMPVMTPLGAAAPVPREPSLQWLILGLDAAPPARVAERR